MKIQNQRSGRILPGLKPVLELLKNNPSKIGEIFCKKNLKELEKIHALAMTEHIPMRIVDQTELDQLCASQDHIAAHQGIAAVLKSSSPLSFGQLLRETASAPLPLLLALDQVKDPGNLGTLVRSAWALGAAGIILPEHESAKPGPAAMKSSAGALELLPVCAVTNLARALDMAQEQDMRIYGTGIAPTNNPDCSSLNSFSMIWDLPAILVLGSETKGIRPGVLKRCTHMIHIPFARPFDSLNIAQAGAILLALCAAYCHSTNPD